MNLSSESRPYLGSGADAVLVAVLWQAFYDCKYKRGDERKEAAHFLGDSGFLLWQICGLPPVLFEEAFTAWVPEHLRNPREQ